MYYFTLVARMYGWSPEIIIGPNNFYDSKFTAGARYPLEGGAPILSIDVEWRARAQSKIHEAWRRTEICQWKLA